VDRWSNAKVVDEVVGTDGHHCTVVELRGKHYGICWDGRPILAVVWAFHQYESCRRTAIALAGLDAGDATAGCRRNDGSSGGRCT
jgi:hypothetical protein